MNLRTTFMYLPWIPVISSDFICNQIKQKKGEWPVKLRFGRSFFQSFRKVILHKSCSNLLSCTFFALMYEKFLIDYLCAVKSQLGSALLLSIMDYSSCSQKTVNRVRISNPSVLGDHNTYLYYILWICINNLLLIKLYQKTP